MKKKLFSLHFILGILGILLILNSSCKKDANSNEEQKIVKQKVAGLVQKGPFINGTSIILSGLNSSLEQTGIVFTSQISNNSGSFEFKNISLSSNYVSFSASGYYFDEVKGDISLAPLNLFALSDVTNISTVNVNILTHLEKGRVEYLVKQKKSFAEAKKIAQGEILSIFGFKPSVIGGSETLDISVNNEGSAILLAVSSILQGSRSVGDLTELLANISNDILEDGILNNESIITNLRNSAKELDLTKIRSNLVKRYQDLGISASIPNFEKNISDFVVFTNPIPEYSTQKVTEITATSVKLNGKIISNPLSTAVSFEYGTSTGYGNEIIATQSPIAANSSADVSASLIGLLPNTIYHCRIKVVDTNKTSYGKDSIFTTQSGVITLSTNAITSLMAFSATTGGNISSDGGSTITARGICFSTTPNPTTTSSTIMGGGGTGSFVSNITGLTSGTTYYVRVYATNSIGTYYGNELNFTTQNGVIILTTSNISAVTAISAASGGNITSDGGALVTSRGICFSTSPNPTILKNIIASGSGTGSFTANLTGLNIGGTYYVRAYATSSVGTYYGNELNFTSQNGVFTLTTLNVTSITSCTASTGINITDNGGSTITAGGVCWNTSQNPTTSNKTDSTYISGTGIFEIKSYGLLPNTTYFLRAWATNGKGTAYGNEVTFTTLALPVVGTFNVSKITPTTASISIEKWGDYTSITAFGTCWSTSQNPTIADSKSTHVNSYNYLDQIAGLSPNTTYYLRGYATNSFGTSYGDQVTFTTSMALTVSTNSTVTAITSTSASCGGNVIADGGATVTTRGVCWSTSHNPTITNSKTNDGVGIGSFTSNLTGLQTKTTYYIRAYATNSGGAVYGNEVSFNTN